MFDFFHWTMGQCSGMLRVCMYVTLQLCYRQPEAHVEALDKQSEVAPHVQDDFDIPEEDLKELDPRDQQENQVRVKYASCCRGWA